MAVFATNLGNQKITYRFKQKEKANEFNTLLKDSIDPGVYAGFAVTLGVGAYTVNIAPGTLYIAATDGSSNKLARIQTQLTFTIVPGTSLDGVDYYVYAHFEWFDVLLNFCNFIISTTPPSGDEVAIAVVRFRAAGTAFETGYPRTDTQLKGTNKSKFLGDVSSLLTTEKTLVGAINDLADGGTW